MSSTLMPTPDRRRPELLAYLPELRARLQRQRDFLAGQVAVPGATDTVRFALGDVEVALHRIATGRYGTCLYCSAELPVASLLAVPELDACAECEQEMASGT